MENGYLENLTLDRINGNKNYEPDNCRWVTMKVQNNNKKNNHFVTIKEITKTVAQWSEEYGLKHGVLQRRLKSKWKEEDLLLPPS